MILVTGAWGSVGRALCERLDDPVAVDMEEMDVTDERQVRQLLQRKRPDVIYHLAGAKHAPEGEDDPWHVLQVNAVGTKHILEHAGGAKVVFASTCKACDPETAYGASKLIAERMVLNAGGTVVRYYNIPESAGNVFRLWEALPASEPIPYTDCWRYFVSMADAVELTLAARDFEPGRYVVDPGLPRHMRAVAEALYPGRELVQIPRRRGDRYQEPLKAACEEIWQVPGSRFCAVRSPYELAPYNGSGYAPEGVRAPLVAA